MTELKADMTPIKLWDCKIGTREAVTLPRGADLPMRMAVQKAFIELTGIDAEFCFSGWGNSLTEAELAVVENRLPDPDRIASVKHADDLVEALKEARRALKMQEGAEIWNSNCVECEGEGDWAECPICTDAFGKAIDARNAAFPLIDAALAKADAQ